MEEETVLIELTRGQIETVREGDYGEIEDTVLSDILSQAKEKKGW